MGLYPRITAVSSAEDCALWEGEIERVCVCVRERERHEEAADERITLAAFLKKNNCARCSHAVYTSQ